MESLSKLYESLAWDTECFGYQVGRITALSLNAGELSLALKQLTHAGVEVVYWSIDASDTSSNDAAKMCHGFLADEKVTYQMHTPLPVTLPPLDQEHVRSYLLHPSGDHLVQLVLTSGLRKYTRFGADPHFINGEFEKVYTAWVVNSLKGELAKEVFVYLVDGNEAGLITLTEKEGRGDVSLLAVDEQFQGRSIGSKLMHAALLRFYDMGYTDVQVVTQKANPACRFYEKFGFKLESTKYIYHFWLT